MGDIQSPGDGPANAFPGKFHAIRNMPAPGKTAADTGGEFPWGCISLGFAGQFPGRSYAQPVNSPANFPDAWISREMPREKASASKKVGAVVGGGGPINGRLLP